jgi:arylsulfatase
VELRLEFECEAPETRGGPAVARLFHGEHLVGQGRIEKQVPGRFGFESLDVGEDTMSPVYPGYRGRLPFRFTGRIDRVQLRLQAAERTAEELVERHLQDD